MESSLKDVPASMSNTMKSTPPKPREEPRHGRRQNWPNNNSTRTHRTVVTGSRSREQTFRTDSRRTRATIVEVAAGIVVTPHNTALIYTKTGRVSGRNPPGGVCPGRIAKQTRKFGRRKTDLWEQTREL